MAADPELVQRARTLRAAGLSIEQIATPAPFDLRFSPARGLPLGRRDLPTPGEQATQQGRRGQREGHEPRGARPGDADDVAVRPTARVKAAFSLGWSRSTSQRQSLWASRVFRCAPGLRRLARTPMRTASTVARLVLR